MDYNDGRPKFVIYKYDEIRDGVTGECTGTVLRCEIDDPGFDDRISMAVAPLVSEILLDDCCEQTLMAEDEKVWGVDDEGLWVAGHGEMKRDEPMQESEKNQTGGSVAPMAVAAADVQTAVYVEYRTGKRKRSQGERTEGGTAENGR